MLHSSDFSDQQVRLINKSTLFAHAPTTIKIPVNNISSIIAGYGVFKEAADNLNGVCFEISLAKGGNNKVLDSDCIGRSDSGQEIRKFYNIQLTEKQSGDLIFKNTCKDSDCSWA